MSAYNTLKTNKSMYKTIKLIRRIYYSYRTRMREVRRKKEPLAHKNLKPASIAAWRSLMPEYFTKRGLSQYP